jgi:hypothetical protein
MLAMLAAASGDHMKKIVREGGDTMRDEYDFSGGVRGKYASRFARGSNVVVLKPDVAEAFPTARVAPELDTDIWINSEATADRAR